MTDEILRVEHLKKYFSTKGGTLHAVDDVSFSIRRRRTLGVVGESGCGKSTLGRSILRLQEPTSGTVQFNGEDILGFDAARLKALRREMQIVFQDPFASLNPRMTVFETITEPLLIQGVYASRKQPELRQKVREIMSLVGLSERLINAYPHELDGGRRQRIGIARALALSPQFIVVFIVSVVCLTLAPWLCYNVLWPSREFGMMIDLSRALVMAVALSAVFWVWMMLLNHVPSFRSLERFLLYTREGKVVAGSVLFVVFFIGAFRYPFVEIPGTVARERNCGWTFTGPRHSIYGALGGVLPTYNLLVLWIGYRILKRQGVFNPVAEGKSGG